MHILGYMVENFLPIRVCYQKILKNIKVLPAILPDANGICKSASSDFTFKTEINLSLKLRLSRTLNSTFQE